jgi:putative transposase
VSAVATTLGLARSTVTARLTPAEPRRRGRPPQRDDDLLARIKAVIADMPTYGYRRVHAILRRAAEQGDGPPAPNHKRVWRVMKQHGLLLQRHAGGEERRHDGRIAVAERNRRWCSDGFEVGCDNGERVRVAFALDCCDREAMSFIATTGGIAGEHIRDLMVAAIEHRFGAVDQLPSVIEWLSDNGSCYIARDTRRFARGIGLEPRTTPLESPQSNGMAEAFVRTFKRDYVRVNPIPNAKTLMSMLPAWFDHYNQVHPHKALRYRSPAEFIRARLAT